MNFGRAETWHTDEFGPTAKTSIVSHHVGGYSVTLTNAHVAAGYKLQWSFELRDGSNYVRESVKIDRTEGQTADGTASQIDLSSASIILGCQNRRACPGLAHRSQRLLCRRRVSDGSQHGCQWPCSVCNRA